MPRTDEATEAMLTIEPPLPRSSMAGRKARIVRYMLRRLTFIENAQSSSLQSRMVP